MGIRWSWARRLVVVGLASACVVGAASPAFGAGSIRADQWHLDAMHAPEMWKTSTGEGITVAVIDGGFKLDHPDLVGQFLPGRDFSGSPGGVGSFVDGHGTEMASLIAGTGRSGGGTGAYGLAPGAKILPLKMNDGSDRSLGASISSDFLDEVGQAVNYAVEQGAKVINVSEESAAVTATPENVAKLNRILAAARAKGVLVVASVGNSAKDGNLLMYPAALPNVVGIGALDRNGTVTDESQTGPHVTLTAPGAEVIDACTSSTGYCKRHGTSAAAALVSASAALVWAVHKDWTANQVLRVLIDTAGKPNDGSNRRDDIGYGVVRPRIALTSPGDPGPADRSPLASDVVLPSSVLSPAAGLPSSASSASGPAASPTAGAVGAPPVQPKAGASSGSVGVLPVVGGVVAGLVLVAGVVFAVLRRRRPAVVEPPVHVPMLPLPPWATPESLQVYRPPARPEE
ncbi:type VII secretion-associated serine protease mycosin [Kitasatospora sp. NPDC059577]|uniref:type VII secretion-associated serine protease mycosin n=1 Tax=Kitasatospora sp. NPDC059577 TaxID=3346873 RepID=UPI0036BFF148